MACPWGYNIIERQAEPGLVLINVWTPAHILWAVCKGNNSRGRNNHEAREKPAAIRLDKSVVRKCSVIQPLKKRSHDIFSRACLRICTLVSGGHWPQRPEPPTQRHASWGYRMGCLPPTLIPLTGPDSNPLLLCSKSTEPSAPPRHPCSLS